MTSKDEIKRLREDGYVVLESFLSAADVDALKQECADLVDSMDPAEHRTVFSTTKLTYRNNYFLDSADRIGYFFEDGALDDKGNLQVEKQKSLNKIGHALHVLCPNFKRITHSEKVKNIAKDLDMVKPTICESMYIFKQPRIGGQVVSHQDATYLFTTPTKKLYGLWIALEDASEDNACLWFIPGSHKNGLYGNYQMIRNPDKDSPESCLHIGDKQEFEQDKFVCVPVKKGDCIIIDGLVVHKSEQNTSERSRHIYTFHMFDQQETEWSETNWLQPTEKGTFTDLYKT